MTDPHTVIAPALAASHRLVTEIPHIPQLYLSPILALLAAMSTQYPHEYSYEGSVD